jgi:lysozyme
MKPRHQASRAAIELIERFEGYRKVAAQLENGGWTIGYGHTRTARKGAEVSPADAEALLIYDLMEISAKLDAWVYTPLSQNQFDALAAFVFNIGLENFRRSAVLRRINEGDLLRAAYAMELWRTAEFQGERIVVDALVRRRAAEKLLFLTPHEGFVPAPSPVLRPRFDPDFGGTEPVLTPVEVRSSLEGERAIAERVTPAPPSPRPAPPEEDEELSASRPVPAEAPSLARTFLEEPEHSAVVTSAGEDEEESPPFSTFALSPPPPETPAEPEAPTGAETMPAMSEPELFSAEPTAFDEFIEEHTGHAEFESFEDLAEVEPSRRLGPTPFLMALGVIGLILFSAGLFWIVSAKGRTDGALLTNPMIIGGGLGILGIGCVASAVYFLLERLGGREEQQAAGMA